MPGLLRDYGVPGSVVSYVANGEVVWTRAFGAANVAAGAPMQPEMVLELGSTGKTLTAWAVMKLVEQGKLELDAPANRYLKRWIIPSGRFDANGVTIRRLLTHTSGISGYGFLDYSPRRATLPDPVAFLSSPHLYEGINDSFLGYGFSPGQVELRWPPGSGENYSGGGFAILQLVVEDVTGEPFDAYFQRELAGPLGATSMRWAWTPELTTRAPTPYSIEGRPLEFRQLAVHGIGSEITSVPDFARFLAALVPGPNGEPAGRGVLDPKTVAEMVRPQPETSGAQGLGYGLGNLDGSNAVAHSGANTGWTAYFIMDVDRRQGFVVASNSSRGNELHLALRNYWYDTAYTPHPRAAIAPAPPLDWIAVAALVPALVLLVLLLASTVVFIRQLRSGRRQRAGVLAVRRLLPVLAWLLPALFTWYWLYSPLPLYLPIWFPDLWPSPATDLLMVSLLGWAVFFAFVALFPVAPREAVTAE